VRTGTGTPWKAPVTVVQRLPVFSGSSCSPAPLTSGSSFGFHQKWLSPFLVSAPRISQGTIVRVSSPGGRFPLGPLPRNSDCFGQRSGIVPIAPEYGRLGAPSLFRLVPTKPAPVLVIQDPLFVSLFCEESFLQRFPSPAPCNAPGNDLRAGCVTLASWGRGTPTSHWGCVASTGLQILRASLMTSRYDHVCFFGTCPSDHLAAGLSSWARVRLHCRGQTPPLPIDSLPILTPRRKGFFSTAWFWRPDDPQPKLPNRRITLWLQLRHLPSLFRAIHEIIGGQALVVLFSLAPKQSELEVVGRPKIKSSPAHGRELVGE